MVTNAGKRFTRSMVLERKWTDPSQKTVLKPPG